MVSSTAELAVGDGLKDTTNTTPDEGAASGHTRPCRAGRV